MFIVTKTIKCICAALCLGFFFSTQLIAQNTDDYRTTTSGSWSNASTWERYNGTSWIAAVSAPNNTNGVITVRSPHAIALPGATIDQVVVEAGATVTQNGWVIVLDAAGIDLQIDGTWNMNSGYLIGPGSTIIQGVFNYSAGDIGGPNFVNPSFTVVEISPLGTFNLNGSAQKFLSRARIENFGTVNWNAGEWHFNANAGADTTKFVNHHVLNIGAGTINLFGQTPTRFVNTSVGIINKNSTGTITTQQSTYFENRGQLNISDGTFSTSNQNASFHNHGIINSTGTGVFNGGWNVLLYTGTFITGNGSIIANGNWQLLGSATLDTGAVISQTGGVIVGPGLLTINGTYNFSAGDIGGPNFINPSFTVVEISPLGTFNLNGSAQKFLNRARIENFGTVNWNAGEWHFNANAGADTTKFVNHHVLNIGAGTLNLFGQTPTRFVNTSVGIINKNSTGTITTQQSTYFENRGQLNISDGTFSTSNQNASFHNHGNINATGTGVFNGGWNVNLYEGTLVTGNGTVNFNGLINVLGNAVCDTGCTINLLGGYIANIGPFKVKGNLNWTDGKIGDFFRPKTNIIIDTVGTLELNTNVYHELAKAELTNYGTIHWNAGEWAITTTVGADTSVFYNDGLCNLNTGATSWTGQSNTHIRNLTNGTILKTASNTTTVQTGLLFKNGGTIGGIGTLVMNATFLTEGTISPGLSPGTITFNNQQPFGTNSTFLVELNDNSGPGVGHDLLERNGNISIAGHLEVVETGIVPNGTYTIVNLTSGNVSGAFTTANLPTGYSIDTTATTVFLTKNFFYQISVTEQICNGDSLFFDGQWLSVPGNYNGTFTSANGFDSIVSLNLIVNPNYYNAESISACGSYTWPVNGITYTADTSVAINFTTIQNCDSLHILNLSIRTVDTSITSVGQALTANATNAQFQWINCSNNQPVQSATQQTFTPISAGVYAVVVSQNGCTDTSRCVEFTSAQTADVWLYPLPITNQLNVELKEPAEYLNVAVYEAGGKIVHYQKAANTRTMVIDFTSEARAVYFIWVKTPTIDKVIKVLKL